MKYLNVPLFLTILFPIHLIAVIQIKVVVVSMFEYGADTGDAPGEFQFWLERNDVRKIEAPLGSRNYYLSDKGLLIMCTGGGVTNAATSVTALALDSRFDLSQAYWIVAGIAGVDPQDASLGSAAWAKWIVDADLAKEIDSREIPEDWPYGYIALGAKQPNTLDGGWQVDVVKFKLNDALVEWHGFALNDWANDWMKLHTSGESNFVMSNMEDSGTATALQRVAKTGKVDFNRLLILRTASNFSTPPIGKDVAWSLNAPYPAGGLPALEAAFDVASVVATALIEGWERYSEKLPTRK